jgi:hypothetical protein
MQQERRGIYRFLRTWIFHALVVILGFALFVSPHEGEKYFASLIFLVTIVWIVRSLFVHPDES